MNGLIRVLLISAVVCGWPGGALAIEKVPFEVAKALKILRGRPFSSGLVFLDGKYLKPPYRVMRYGNQIMINDRPVTGPIVAWDEFLETQTNLKTIEVEEPVSPSSVEEDDSAEPKKEKPSASVTETAVRVVIEERRLAAFAGDTMKLTDIPADTEEDIARQKRAEENARLPKSSVPTPAAEEPAPASTDEEDGLDPASPEGEAAARAETEKRAAPSPVATRLRKVTTLDGPFVPNARSRTLLKRVDGARTKIEGILRRGGFIFFGTKYRPVLGDEIGAKTLIQKLPELMRDASDGDDFYHLAQSAGLMVYLTYSITQDLYRNRGDFANLMERRRALNADEKLKRLMNHGR